MHTRPASIGDYAAFTRLFPALGVPDPTPSEARFAEAILPDAYVAEDAADVLGIVWARKRGVKLHVVYLIVDEVHRRRGVGRALMGAAAEHGRSLGLATWMLNVKPENTAARRLYSAIGMREVMASVSLKLAWASVARLPLSPATTEVTPLTDDARFEAVPGLGLGHSELAAMRALPGRVFYGAESEGQPVGLVAFDAAFPGVSPFRMTAPIHARALLESVAPLAQHDHVHAFVEGDPALEELLTSVGATPSLRTLRMEGDIPAR